MSRIRTIQSFLLLTLPLLSLCSPPYPLSKRGEVCTLTPSSTTNSTADDAVLINQAFKQCGNGGTITIPENTSFTLRSSVDLSPCHACQFNIFGNLVVDPSNTIYWKFQSSVFSIKNVTGLVINGSSSAIIDASNVGSKQIDLNNQPDLFSISNSTQIYIYNLSVRNILRSVFTITDHSEGVHISGLESKTFGATHVFYISASQHIYLNDNHHSTGYDCWTLAGNASNVEIRDSYCDLQAKDKYIEPSAVHIFYSRYANDRLEFVRNVLVDNVRATGDGFSLVYLDASVKFLWQLELSNATFSEITTLGSARVGFYITERDTKLVAKDVLFKEWRFLEYNASNFGCKGADTCEFRLQNWKPVVPVHIGG